MDLHALTQISVFPHKSENSLRTRIAHESVD